MQILDPSKIKDEKKKTEQETQRRILALQHEEAEANRRTNDAREREAAEKKRIEAEANKGVPELQAKKATLENEVKVLEARKLEAQKPIQTTIDEANAQLAENLKQGELIRAKLAQLDKDHELLLDRLEKQSDDQSAIDTQLNDIARARKGLEAEQAINKQAAINLGQKLADFHTLVAKTEAELASRETRINIQSEANEVRAAELDRVAAAQLETDRGLQDKYRTLEAAIKEAKEKHGVIL